VIRSRLRFDALPRRRFLLHPTIVILADQPGQRPWHAGVTLDGVARGGGCGQDTGRKKDESSRHS
jgi:hypothetical protein